MPIEFRCLQCQHLQKVDESKIGQQVYCQVCYYKLTVPAKSTVKPIEETQQSELYALDSAPLDVQKMQERREELISFPCDLCKTLIGVRKEQIGEEIVCPECGTIIIVPKSVAAIAEARLQDKLNKAKKLMSHKETYSLSDGTTLPTDVPTNDKAKQFRVPCRLCGTALFATEDQVGTFLTCPDCETKTEVPPPQKTLSSKNETAPLPPVSFEGDTAFDIAAPSNVVAENLVPVICHLCGTRMYAAELQIGQFKTCPDCGRQTKIKAVPKHQMTTTSTISSDAYGISNAGESAPRPVLRTLTDYRRVEGSLDQQLHAERYRNKQTSRRSFERPPLPKRPFTERFFVPFGHFSTWLHPMLFVAVGPLGMMMLWSGVWATEGHPIGVIITGPFVFLMCVAALGYLVSFAVQFYGITSSGMDEIEFEGELVPFDYFITGLWLLTFLFVSVLPGLLIGNILCQSLDLITDSPVTAFLVIYVMIRVSHLLFFPIFFLSSMESGSMFALLAKNTIISFWHQPFAWFRFYLLTGMLFVFFDLCFIFAPICLAPNNNLMSCVLIAVFFFLFAVQLLFFFRLLGRLAWLIEETDRQKRELEEEEENENE